MLVDIISLKSCVYNHSFATVRTTAAYYNDYPAMIDILGQRVLLLLIPFLRILGNCHGEDCLSRLCIYNAARTQTRLDVLYSSLTTDQSINIFWCQYILCIPYNSKLYSKFTVNHPEELLGGQLTEILDPIGRKHFRKLISTGFLNRFTTSRSMILLPFQWFIE